MSRGDRGEKKRRKEKKKGGGGWLEGVKERRRGCDFYVDWPEGQAVGDGDLRKMLDVLHGMLRQLRTVDFGGVPLRSGGVARVAEVLRLAEGRLLSVNLSSTQCGSDGLVALADFLSRVAVDELDVSGNGITDAALDHLKDHLPRNALRGVAHLDLSSNAIADGEVLGDFLAATGVQGVSLSGNRLREARAIRTNHRSIEGLRYVNVSGMAEGWDEMVDACPSLQWMHGVNGEVSDAFLQRDYDGGTWGHVHDALAAIRAAASADAAESHSYSDSDDDGYSEDAGAQPSAARSTVTDEDSPLSRGSRQSSFSSASYHDHPDHSPTAADDDEFAYSHASDPRSDKPHSDAEPVEGREVDGPDAAGAHDATPEPAARPSAAEAAGGSADAAAPTTDPASPQPERVAQPTAEAELDGEAHGAPAEAPEAVASPAPQEVGGGGTVAVVTQDAHSAPASRQASAAASAGASNPATPDASRIPRPLDETLVQGAGDAQPVAAAAAASQPPAAGHDEEDVFELSPHCHGDADIVHPDELMGQALPAAADDDLSQFSCETPQASQQRKPAQHNVLPEGEQPTGATAEAAAGVAAAPSADGEPDARTGGAAAEPTTSATTSTEDCDGGREAPSTPADADCAPATGGPADAAGGEAGQCTPPGAGPAATPGEAEGAAGAHETATAHDMVREGVQAPADCGEPGVRADGAGGSPHAADAARALAEEEAAARGSLEAAAGAAAGTLGAAEAAARSDARAAAVRREDDAARAAAEALQRAAEAALGAVAAGEAEGRMRLEEEELAARTAVEVGAVAGAGRLRQAEEAAAAEAVRIAELAARWAREEEARAAEEAKAHEEAQAARADERKAHADAEGEGRATLVAKEDADRRALLHTAAVERQQAEAHPPTQHTAVEAAGAQAEHAQQTGGREEATAGAEVLQTTGTEGQACHDANGPADAEESSDSTSAASHEAPPSLSLSDVDGIHGLAASHNEDDDVPFAPGDTAVVEGREGKVLRVVRSASGSGTVDVEFAANGRISVETFPADTLCPAAAPGDLTTPAGAPPDAPADAAGSRSPFEFPMAASCSIGPSDRPQRTGTSADAATPPFALTMISADSCEGSAAALSPMTPEMLRAPEDVPAPPAATETPPQQPATADGDAGEPSAGEGAAAQQPPARGQQGYRSAAYSTSRGQQAAHAHYRPHSADPVAANPVGAAGPSTELAAAAPGGGDGASLIDIDGIEIFEEKPSGLLLEFQECLSLTHEQVSASRPPSASCTSKHLERLYQPQPPESRASSRVKRPVSCMQRYTPDAPKLRTRPYSAGRKRVHAQGHHSQSPMTRHTVRQLRDRMKSPTTAKGRAGTAHGFRPQRSLSPEDEERLVTRLTAAPRRSDAEVRAERQRQRAAAQKKTLKPNEEASLLRRMDDYAAKREKEMQTLEARQHRATPDNKRQFSAAEMAEHVDRVYASGVQMQQRVENEAEAKRFKPKQARRAPREVSPRLLAPRDAYELAWAQRYKDGALYSATHGL